MSLPLVTKYILFSSLLFSRCYGFESRPFSLYSTLPHIMKNVPNPPERIWNTQAQRRVIVAARARSTSLQLPILIAFSILHEYRAKRNRKLYNFIYESWKLFPSGRYVNCMKTEQRNFCVVSVINIIKKYDNDKKMVCAEKSRKVSRAIKSNGY